MEKIELIKQTRGNTKREVYNSLRTNLLFTGVENRVLLITSCFPGEGKSTVSFDLAISYAESGKNVLWIDADMRRSTFMEKCQSKKPLEGLSHYLSGQSLEEEVIYATNYEKLYVIPAGFLPRNPSDLLVHERMTELMQHVRAEFDFIVIDTPPLGSVIDAAVAAKYADATMMVVANNTVLRQTGKSIMEKLKQANPNFLGVVLNKVEVNKNGYGKYYSKYYGNYYGQK